MFAKRPQAFAGRSQAFAEGRTCRKDERDENRREMQNCRHFLRFALQKCQHSQGSGGSWSRNPGLSSLLDSSRLFASQKCQHIHRDRGGRGRETQNCRHFWTRPASSRLKSVNIHRDRGRGRETQNCRHFWTCLVSSRLKSVNIHRDRGRGRETQNCRHFWTCLVSSRLKSVNIFTGIGGSSRLFASQKCQHSQGSGGSWSRNPELSSLLDSSRLFASQKCQHIHRDRGGRGRETQNCRHFWTRPASSRLKSVNIHRDRGRGRETQNCRHFWTRRWTEKGERREEKREKREEKERGGERGERDDPGPTSPKWFRPWGVIIIACTCHVCAFGFVAPIWFWGGSP